MIDMLKAEVEFKNYLKNFDVKDPKIALKITHTYEVLNSAKYIANKLNLEKEDYDLACLIALLHDIGRFEQLKEYDSYDDTLGMNHAEFGIKLLFDEGYIKNFVDVRDYDEIIYKAIANHNKYKVDDTGHAYHVGLYLGNGMLIEAKGRDTGVVISTLNSSWNDANRPNYK